MTENQLLEAIDRVWSHPLTLPKAMIKRLARGYRKDMKNFPAHLRPEEKDLVFVSRQMAKFFIVTAIARSVCPEEPISTQWPVEQRFIPFFEHYAEHLKNGEFEGTDTTIEVVAQEAESSS